MIFWNLLVFLFNALWLGTALGLIGVPLYATVLGSYREPSFGDTAHWHVGLIAGGACSVIGGVMLLLLFLAIQFGGINLLSHPDGCYHVYWVPGGKSGHTEYDPITCPAGIGQ